MLFTVYFKQFFVPLAIIHQLVLAICITVVVLTFNSFIFILYKNKGVFISALCSTVFQASLISLV